MSWFSHLLPEDRETLEAYRAHYAENYPEDMSFARNYTENTHSPNFYQSLESAETPEERARVYMEAEIAAYPFALAFLGSPDYDV